MKLLEIRNLSVYFESPGGAVPAVEGVSLDIGDGEIVGLVGETGCGKTTLALSLLGLCPGRVEGEALFRLRGGGIVDLIHLPPEALSKLRGEELALIYQEPGEALSPVYRVGEQLVALLRKHFNWMGKEEALRLLEAVGLAPAVFELYPHQMSLGMLRRVTIALALSGNPRLLIADEPTAALDSVSALQIVWLLSHLCRQRGMSLLFISHDLSLAFRLCSRIAVMFQGRLWELAPAAKLWEQPCHIYTRRLLSSIPRPPSPFIPPPPFPRSSQGCPFHPTCSKVLGRCREEVPSLREIAEGHYLACHAF